VRPRFTPERIFGRSQRAAIWGVQCSKPNSLAADSSLDEGGAGERLVLAAADATARWVLGCWVLGRGVVGCGLVGCDPSNPNSDAVAEDDADAAACRRRALIS